MTRQERLRPGLVSHLFKKNQKMAEGLGFILNFTIFHGKIMRFTALFKLIRNVLDKLFLPVTNNNKINFNPAA
jgi:hypothetical protein